MNLIEETKELVLKESSEADVSSNLSFCMVDSISRTQCCYL